MKPNGQHNGASVRQHSRGWDLEEHRRARDAVRRETLKSPEAARAFLRRAGIIDDRGELTEPYR